MPLLNKVLIVEDSPTIQKLIRLYVNQQSMIEGCYAGSLQEAQNVLEGMQQGEMLCALLDLNLPDAPNGEIVTLVQEYDIPIIILSARSKNTLPEEITSKNVIDYVYKKNMKELEYVVKNIQTLYQNQQRHVLIVEDSAFYLKRFSQALENLRLPITTAANGLEALQVLEENPDIQLVITDYNMPDMDGLELIENIRQNKTKEELGIIGLSAANNNETALEFLKAGANDYMSKPPMSEELYCRVQNTLNTLANVKAMRDMANTDFLTKIHNRRQFFEAGEKLYSKLKKKASFMLLALIDADNFKSINDTYGHEAGDKVLINLANTFKSILPKNALIARFGGEEFTCVCNLENEVEAEAILEQLRQSVEALTIIHEGHEIKVTISVGVSTVFGASFQDMINSADEAVYVAKSSGRNKVVFSSETQRKSS